jgi:short-subunit dehydrogenase
VKTTDSATATPRRCALVTGASNGIGLELAGVLAREGHALIITARNQAVLDGVARALSASHGVPVHPVAADLGSPEAAEGLMREVVAAGLSVDVLVNNAGFGLFGAFATTPLESEQRMIAVNISALVTLTKLCLPGMVERHRGRVLNVASTAAFLPGPNMAVYYATKAFVLSFSEAIADELRGTGVTVTALCPGPTQTAFQRVAGMHQSRLVQGTMMSASDVAEAAYRGMLAGDPVVIPGFTNSMVPLLVRLLPRRLATIVSRRAAEERRTGNAK